MDPQSTLAAPPAPHLKFLLGFIIAIGPVSVDMYLPAAARIAAEFGPAVPQLTLAAYFAGFAVGQLAQGLVSDRWGRRAPLAAGLLLYTIASICCACTQGALSFYVFRALAAFGAAASIVVPRAMVRDLADGTRAAELMSGVMQVMSVAPVLAPVLGSLVLLCASWRVIFVLAALYGVIGLVLTWRFLPETLPLERRLSSDVLATLRRFATILRERGFLGNALVGTFGMSALFAYLAGSPTLFMRQYGYSPLAYGASLAVLGAATIVFFRINTALVRRRGAPRALRIGLALWLAASAYLALSSLHAPASSVPVWLALLVFTFGYCLIPSNSQVGALSRHAAHAATATALMSTLQYSGGAIAGALVGSLADGSGRPMAWIMFVCELGAAAALRLI